MFLKKKKNIVLLHLKDLILNIFFVEKMNLKLKYKTQLLKKQLLILYKKKKKDNLLSLKKVIFFDKKDLSNIYYKIQKLIFYYMKSIEKYSIYNKNSFNNIYLKKKKKKIKHLLLLNVTFGKRNTFFNVSSGMGKTLYLTTVSREGYVGRKKAAYTSLFGVTSLVKKIISNFYINKYCDLCIVYKGWSRYRAAIQAAFNKKKLYNLNIKFIKYIVKIPHNGCRPPKQRNRLKRQKYFPKKLTLK